MMFEKVISSKKIIIKDSTLREGEDVSDVNFKINQKLKIARLLNQVQVPEIEAVAPGKVLKDLKFVKKLKKENLTIRASGLVYTYNPRAREEIKEAGIYLDRLDLLMPVSSKRKPYGRSTKINLLVEMLSFSLRHLPDVGVGFPHTAPADIEFLQNISTMAVRQGAKRVTLYDTNGSLDPFEVYHLIKRLKEELEIPIFFHGHNDLGLATANSLAAAYAGADGLDVTINGLGDRAGNASLEQVVLCLYLKGYETKVILQDLRRLSQTVEKESGVRVFKLAPVVGKHIFVHKSPGHLENPELFEAFDPKVVGSERKLNNK
jgi:isopropylmalate/homocitrate/citramalate synthase